MTDDVDDDITPPLLCPLLGESPEFALLLSSFEFVALTLGEEAAQRLWRDAARRPRGRPYSSGGPEQEKEMFIQMQIMVQLLSCDRLMPYLPVKFQLRKSFELVEFTLGKQAARRLWKNVAKRSRGRPPGSSGSEQDKALLELIDAAINNLNPVSPGRLAMVIHDKLPLEFGPSPKAIEMRLRRLIGSRQ